MELLTSGFIKRTHTRKRAKALINYTVKNGYACAKNLVPFFSLYTKSIAN